MILPNPEDYFSGNLAKKRLDSKKASRYNTENPIFKGVEGEGRNIPSIREPAVGESRLQGLPVVCRSGAGEQKAKVSRASREAA